MMDAHIYCVTNLISGKQYVGQTMVNRNKVGHGQALKDAYNKYGKEQFSYDRVCTGIQNRAVLNYLERFWISICGTTAPNGYNIERGGTDKDEVSAETRLKLKMANLGKTLSLETKLKISMANRGKKNHFYGKTHSAEAIRKIVAANIGKVVVISDEQKLKIGFANAGAKNGMYGKKHTEATKEKFKTRPVARHWLGKTFSAEHKAHLTVDKICPHCAKEGKGNAMIRWHFDNCRNKGALS